MNPRFGEHVKSALQELYRTDPLTDEERAEHARLVHEQKWREQKAATDLFEEAQRNGR